jgi:hypothetical protein
MLHNIRGFRWNFPSHPQATLDTPSEVTGMNSWGTHSIDMQLESSLVSFRTREARDAQTSMPLATSTSNPYNTSRHHRRSLKHAPVPRYFTLPISLAKKLDYYGFHIDTLHCHSRHVDSGHDPLRVVNHPVSAGRTAGERRTRFCIHLLLS